MKFNTYQSDLYVLPETKEEEEKFLIWVQENKGKKFYTNPIKSLSNVKGQDWFGKTFYEIPFMASLKNDIENYIKGD